MGKGAKVKGYLMEERTGKLMRFIYNPEEFEYEYSTDFAVVKPPGSPHPVYQFVGGNERMIRVELFLDGREKKTSTIKEWEDFIARFYPLSKGKGFHPPSPAIFAIGPFVKKVLIRNVNWRYTMFDKNLKPVHAILALEMETIM